MRLLFCGYGPVATQALQALADIPWIHIVGVLDWQQCQHTRHPLWVRWASSLYRSSLSLQATAQRLKIQPFKGFTGLCQGHTPLAPYLNSQHIDAVMLCSWGEKLPPSLIHDGRLWLNLHPSLLPRHRGANPVAMALWQQEIETGLTLHRINEAYDAGDILHQEHLRINTGSNSSQLREQLAQLSHTLTQHCFQSEAVFQQRLLLAVPQKSLDSSSHTLKELPHRLPFYTTPLETLHRAVLAMHAWGGIELTDVVQGGLRIRSLRSWPHQNLPLNKQGKAWNTKHQLKAVLHPWGTLKGVWLYHPLDDAWVYAEL